MDTLITIIWSLPNIFMNQNITLSSFLIILQGKNYHPLLRMRLGRWNVEYVPGLGLHCSFLSHGTRWRELSSEDLESYSWSRIAFSEAEWDSEPQWEQECSLRAAVGETLRQSLEGNYLLICWVPLIVTGGDNETSSQKYLNWPYFKIWSWHSDHTSHFIIRFIFWLS